MDFDHAIAAHSAWKAKLSNYLKKPDHSLNPAQVSLDNACELGKWIAGEGKQFAGLPEFAKVKADHARFHKVAANVVQRANAGEHLLEEVSLGAKSEFASASNAVVRSLMALKSKVAAPVGT
jgi:hypothetical protein